MFDTTENPLDKQQISGYNEINREGETNMDAYIAEQLPLKGKINIDFFMDELVESYAALQVYRVKVKDSRLDSSLFMPVLQQKEAMASSAIEGTQATLDDVLKNQVEENRHDKDGQKIANYFFATERGTQLLQNGRFTTKLIKELHSVLMENLEQGSEKEIGNFRSRQNCIARLDSNPHVVFTPPAPENVESLMQNLIQYMVNPSDNLYPIIRTAIIHAQFLTIHPFMDGNGRVGRILIPLYMYATRQIDTPYFFVSEALERDKFRYYKFLTDIREKDKWNEWIRFFLITVKNQCAKYIKMVDKINALYERDLEKACSLLRTNKMKEIIDLLYQYPIVTSNWVSSETNIPMPTVNRYLNLLVDNEILYTDQKQRNRTFFYYDLLNIIRD